MASALITGLAGGLGGKGGGGGNLSPEQNALLAFQGQQGTTRIGDIYSRLGLGNSTMKVQDQNAAGLANLATAAGLEQQNIQNTQQQFQNALNLGNQLQGSNNQSQANAGANAAANQGTFQSS